MTSKCPDHWCYMTWGVCANYLDIAVLNELTDAEWTMLSRWFHSTTVLETKELFCWVFWPSVILCFHCLSASQTYSPVILKPELLPKVSMWLPEGWAVTCASFSVSFSSRWHRSAQKSPYAHRSVSQQSSKQCQCLSGWTQIVTAPQRTESRPLPFSTPLSLRRSMLWCSGLSMFRKFLKPRCTSATCAKTSSTRWSPECYLGNREDYVLLRNLSMCVCESWATPVLGALHPLEY